MQKIILALTIFILPAFSKAQVLQNNGAALTITTGGSLFVAGSIANSAGNITNNGIFGVSGNITNNATIISSAGGTLQLRGTGTQTLSGTAIINTTNLVVNNAAGVTLSTKLRISGTVTFTSGIITAPNSAAALQITATGSLANTPADASHVNGYVIKEGIGSFDFPVGDATKYQKVTLNLTGNATGVAVKYNAADAGAGTFTAGGTEAMPLVSYNKSEYWEMAPLSTAAGSVTIYWDGYNDSYTNPAGQRKVAHKAGGNWLNEGSTATGTITSGSVTSNSISTWSPFTLGSVAVVLPLNWLSIRGALDAQGHVVLDWNVAESDVAEYRVEKSINGTDFHPLSVISSYGAGTHTYHFNEAARLLNNAWYRVLQTDKDGRYSYSPVVKIKAQKKRITVYPTIFETGFYIITESATSARMADMQGRAIKTVLLAAGNNHIDADELAKGTYLLLFADGYQQRIIKQ